MRGKGEDMAEATAAPAGEGKLEAVLAALRKSLAGVRKYLVGSTIFYVALIATFSVLVAVVEEKKARGADIGILILVSLGFLGMWIYSLRGLRGGGFSVSGFLSLYRLPLAGKLEELEDASGWSDEGDRMKRAMEVLEHQAAAEKEHRAWPNRALSLSVITVIDLLIWLVWKNWHMALINQGIAMVVSMTHISLGPKASMRALEELGGEA